MAAKGEDLALSHAVAQDVMNSNFHRLCQGYVTPESFMHGILFSTLNSKSFFILLTWFNDCSTTTTTTTTTS